MLLGVGDGFGVGGLGVVGNASIQLTILVLVVSFFTFFFLSVKDLRKSIADNFFFRFGTAGIGLKFGSNHKCVSMYKYFF